MNLSIVVTIRIMLCKLCFAYIQYKSLLYRTMFLFPLISVVDVVNKGEVLTDNAGQSVDGKFLVVMLTLLWGTLFSLIVTPLLL